ncbi:MAG TPA: hypothetical protein ENO27_02810 [Caldithrix sp.]|nr:hypothetical protein [Caldithrix sp.]
MKPTTSSKKLIENLAGVALDTLGAPIILDLIRSWQDAKILSRKQAYDLRRVIRRLSKPPESQTNN